MSTPPVDSRIGSFGYTAPIGDGKNNNGNDFIYDLQGRRVSEPKKGGIYIKNGKKILF